LREAKSALLLPNVLWRLTFNAYEAAYVKLAHRLLIYEAEPMHAPHTFVHCCGDLAAESRLLHQLHLEMKRRDSNLAASLHNCAQ
jgi:hypothetical protein